MVSGMTDKKEEWVNDVLSFGILSDWDIGDGFR